MTTISTYDEAIAGLHALGDVLKAVEAYLDEREPDAETADLRAAVARFREIMP